MTLVRFIKERTYMKRPTRTVNIRHGDVKDGKYVTWNVPTKVPVKTLEEAIMESADWSTSSMTILKCTQGDIEAAIKPVVRALGRIKGDPIVDSARTKLAALYEGTEEIQERVFKDTVSPAARKLAGLAAKDCPGSSSEAVHAALVKMIKPIADELDQVKSRFIPRIVKKLRAAYELRWYDGDDDYARAIVVDPANARPLRSVLSADPWREPPTRPSYL